MSIAGSIISSVIIPLVTVVRFASLDANVFSVTDDAPPGNRLGRIAYFDGKQHTPVEAGTFKSMIVRSNRPPASYFSVEEHTGYVYTKILIDREAVCIRPSDSSTSGYEPTEWNKAWHNGRHQSTNDCQFQFQVALYRKVDGQSSWSNVPEFIDVSVDVLDRNDHAPTFNLYRTVNLSILESAPVGTRIRLPLAVDPDSLKYSIKKYQIIPPDTSEWILHQQTNEIIYQGTVDQEIVGLFLELRTALDREQTSSYQFEIKVSDSFDEMPTIYDGNNILKVTVLVEDVNDNGPIFRSQQNTDSQLRGLAISDITTYRVRVTEATWTKSALLRLQASDEDTFSFAITRYEFASNDDANINSLFKLNENTGELFLRQPLDYEQKSLFAFHVLAIDSEHDRRMKLDGMSQEASATASLSDRYTATAMVLIEVVDMNDESPVIEIDYLRTDETTRRPATYAKIQENLDPPQFVANLMVTDRDANLSNNHVTCKLQQTAVSMDQFSGSGYPPDHTTLLYKSRFQLNEVRRQFGQVQYNLVTSATLDREDILPAGSALRVGITCSDSGQPIQKTYTTAVVQVQDVNDNDPVIRLVKPPNYRKSEYFTEENDNIVEIYENSPIGSLVARVNATDRDLGQNGYVTCRFANETEFNFPSISHYFHIDQVGCDVSVRNIIDRESTDSLMERVVLAILAEDHGEPPRTGQLKLDVLILNENDNPPVVQQFYYKFNVEENLPAGTSVGQLIIHDRDQVYDNISFKFQKQNVGPFALWAQTGQSNKPEHLVCHINTTKPLDRELKESYEFVILVIDASDNKMIHVNSHMHPTSYTVSVNVLVTVDDVNDNDPTIIFPHQPNKTFRLSSGERQNYQLLTVNANDKDSVSTQFIFSLIEESRNLSVFTDYPRDQKRSTLKDILDILPHKSLSFLDIDSNTGVIYLNRDMCENDTGLHAFRVIVEDNAKPSRSVSMRFLVLVEPMPPRSRQLYTEPEKNQYLYRHASATSHTVQIFDGGKHFGFDRVSMLSNAEETTSKFREIRQKIALPRFTGDTVLILSLGLLLLLLLATLCLVLYARRSDCPMVTTTENGLRQSRIHWTFCRWSQHKKVDSKNGYEVRHNTDRNENNTVWMTIPKEFNDSVLNVCPTDEHDRQNFRSLPTGTWERPTLQTGHQDEKFYNHDCPNFSMHLPSDGNQLLEYNKTDEYMALQSANRCPACCLPSECNSLKSNQVRLFPIHSQYTTLKTQINSLGLQQETSDHYFVDCGDNADKRNSTCHKPTKMV